LAKFPLVGEPGVEIPHGPGRKVDQQLREVKLRIDFVAATGGGQAGQDGRCFVKVGLAYSSADKNLQQDSSETSVINAAKLSILLRPAAELGITRKEADFGGIWLPGRVGAAAGVSEAVGGIASRRRKSSCFWSDPNLPI
jgi:hypothetical protein